VKIGELARRTNIPARMLRYYEEQGLLTPRRLDNGYRDYDESLADRVEKIRCFIDAGVPMRAIERLLSSTEGAEDAWRAEVSAEFGGLLLRERDRMAARIDSLERSLASMTRLIEDLEIEASTTPHRAR
jgi:DNA-binding transcriptional MerR regulator